VEHVDTIVIGAGQAGPRGDDDVEPQPGWHALSRPRRTWTEDEADLILAWNAQE
jgi:hypothetical protein